MASGTSNSGFGGRALTGVSLVLIAVGFVAAVLFANNAFKSSRIDLTDDGLFTLSDGTRNVINSIDEPITLRFYFSSRLAREIPQIGIYGQRVQDMLEEFATEGQGKIRLEIHDPLPFTDVEDRAVAFGLRGVPVDQTGETVYFGLAGVNATDDQLAIPFFDEQREKFLEYDLARMVYGLANPKKPKVGVITKLPVSGSRFARMAPNAPDDSWMIWAQAQNLFEMEEIDAYADELPEDLDLLVMIHPPFMNNITLYAIDQFVLKGGRLVIFVDPHSEADAQRPAGQGGAQQQDFGSAANLKELFDAWGVSVPADMVAGDVKNGQKVRAPDRSRTRMQAVQYPLWMLLREPEMSPTDITTSQLQVLRVASPGHVVRAENGLDVEPLILTSDQGGVIEVARIQGNEPDIVGVSTDLEPVGPQIISARLSGKPKTAFPDGPPQPIAMKDDDASADEKAKAEAAWEEQKKNHVAEAQENVAIVLTADVDMLADGLWVQVRDMFGQRIAVPLANNGAFFQNLLENMTGSSDLIDLRSRGGFQKPFTLIEEIQRDAERDFRAKEQELLARMTETEQKLGQVQQATDPSGNTQIVLSDSQRAEIEKFQQDLLSIRKELRDVQFALRSDVEELTGKIKLVNIAAMPLAVAVLAILGAVVRNQRRKSFQAKFAQGAAPGGAS